MGRLRALAGHRRKIKRPRESVCLRAAVRFTRSAMSQIESSSAGPELVDLRTVELRDREEQIRGRLFLSHDVATALQLAVRAAEQQGRRVTAIVEVAVAHTAAEVDQ